MATSTILLLALIGSIGLVNCQFDERDREIDRRRGRLAEGCAGKVMDVFFLLDSSSSIYINDYMSQHSLTRNIISRFDVTSQATRVGMLTFSDDLERPVLNINQYNSKSELLNSISVQNLPYRTGVTNTDLAIRYVRQLNDFRQDITKVMIVMTDGGSRSPGQTAREAELARSAGFYMFVVGIGQYIEEREWRSIASDPDDSFVFNITNARFLDDVQYSLPPRACALPPIRLGGSCDVSRMSEVYFVAGRSTSDRAIAFMESFNRRTRDQRDLLRVNYLIDGCATINNMVIVPDEPFVCERFDTRTGDLVTPTSASEMFSQAIRALRDSRNSRGDTNQVIVLFADDDTMSTDRFDLANSARTAQNFQGASVVVADLGIRNYRDFASRIVSSRNNLITFNSGPMANQSGAQRQLLDSICYAANSSSDGPDFRANPN